RGVAARGRAPAAVREHDRRDRPEGRVARVALHDDITPGQLLLRRVHRPRVDTRARIQVRQELVPVEVAQRESGPHGRSGLEPFPWSPAAGRRFFAAPGRGGPTEY